MSKKNNQVVETTLAPSKVDLKKLDTHVKAIERLTESAKKSIFEIAVRMNIIKSEELYKADGFKNVYEFAASRLGYARSTTANYIRIAEQYLQIESNDRGKMIINTICVSTNPETGEKVDYKIGQLNALGKVSAADFQTLHNEKVITPEMGADAIKKAVADYYADDTDDVDDTDDADDTDDTDDNNGETFNRLRDKIINMLGDLAGMTQDTDTENAIRAAVESLQSI